MIPWLHSAPEGSLTKFRVIHAAVYTFSSSGILICISTALFVLYCIVLRLFNHGKCLPSSRCCFSGRIWTIFKHNDSWIQNNIHLHNYTVIQYIYIFSCQYMPNSLTYQVPITKQSIVHTWTNTDCFCSECEKLLAPNWKKSSGKLNRQSE